MGSRIATAAVTTLALLGVAVPLALSDEGAAPSTLDPCAAVNGSASVDYCDTPVSPTAKHTKLWEQIGGAKAGESEVLPTSPTRFVDDLYAVGFRNQSQGLAGGAACDDPEGDVETCPRHPVVYRYSDTDGRGPRWWRDTSFPGGGRGYVGAIAWIPNTDRFLAVGGTGCYPRRELPCPAGAGPAAGAADPIAGMARVWLLDGGEWQELTPPEIDASTRGLTALDFTPTPAPAREHGVAGGLGQLWVWKDGAFVEKIDSGSPKLVGTPRGTYGIEATKENFRFRVRDVRAQVDVQGRPLKSGRFLALTSGCCTADPVTGLPDPAKGQPVVLSDDGSQWAVINPFHARQVESGYDARRVSGYALIGRITSDSTSRVATAQYALMNTDGPEAALEPPSELRYVPGSGTPGSHPITGGMRLVAGDGMLAWTEGARSGVVTKTPFDWYVGVDRATGHGVAYGLGVPQPTTGIDTEGAASGDVSVDDVDKERASRGSYRLLDLGSYGLNAIRMMGETSGVGWAVGDRGALVSLGESAPQDGVEPSPPAVGPAKPAPLTEKAAFDAFRPLVDDPGSGDVPSLARQPLEERSPPGFVAAGAADPAGAPADVTAIVMSRDGGEGWAVGGSRRLALYHYDGTHWSACKPIGAPPLIPADPRCSGLANLAARDLRLRAAARVPYENGDEPSRADEFEVVAVGDYEVTRELRREVVVRYRDGVWGPEDAKAARSIDGDVVDTEFDSSLRSIAFTAPDDGWAIGTTTDRQTGGNPAPIYRFDGRQWIDCLTVERAGDLTSCDDEDRRLPEIFATAPVRQDVLGVAAVGRRVYLWGARTILAGASFTGATTVHPLILHHDPDGSWTAADGGLDPGRDEAGGQGRPASRGYVARLTVGGSAEEGYRGWAFGFFTSTDVPAISANGKPVSAPPAVPDARMLRLESGSESWTAWKAHDAASDHLAPAGQAGTGATRGVVTTSLDSSPFGSSVMASETGPLLGFGDETPGWRVLPGPVNPSSANADVIGQVEALAADPAGGFWMAAGKPGDGQGPAWFYHYSDRARQPVFSDVAHPVQRRVTALAGARDGTVWLATDSDLLARYDRLTGWDTVSVPGWDPGRLVTTSSPVHAIALGPDGRGLAVGAGGRIADLGPAVRLDEAAGAPLCSESATQGACGTARALRAVAIAPDGSALVGGDGLALLWRPAGERFRGVTRPRAALGARITGIAMPSANSAWLGLSTGQVFVGDRRADDWEWTLENVDRATGDLLSKDATGNVRAVRAVAIDGSKGGFAVGDHGLVLQRNDGIWRRLETGFADDLTSVALPAGSGNGALIGGANGLVLTLDAGRFAVAHEADAYSGRAKAVVGLAMLPGVAPGQTEAWAALSNSSSGSVLLHYASDTAEPLLDPGGRVTPLSDSPGPRAGEFTVAAFGKSDCHISTSNDCDPLTGSALASDVTARRVAEAIAREGERSGVRPSVALFTGDINDSAGQLRHSQVQTDGDVAGTAVPASARTVAPNVSQWATLVAGRLRAAGVPVFGAFGAADVTSERYCVPNAGCFSQKQIGGQGACAANQCVASLGNANVNVLWRGALADQPAPWGQGEPVESAGLRFEPLDRQSASVQVRAESARTHYALDVVDDRNGGRKLARIVVVDNAQRSLAASDPAQEPVEPGGQQTWLSQVLCVDGPGCTRDASEQAIVLANTPTYSYGPGGGTGTATDAAAFESTLISNHANLVVSGRLGWNALYYALAPGLHEPCPGGSYPEAAPTGLPDCGVGTDSTADAPDRAESKASDAARAVGDVLLGVGVPPPPDAGGTLNSATSTGLLPFVVASGAGGKLATPTGEGMWHGYTIVRLDGSGDPGRTIVEQRPVFDWLSITARERTLQPGQRIKLHGVGRQPLSIDEQARMVEVDSPAITHRYDLLAADPALPYLPSRDANGDYVRLDPSVATVDPQSGVVRAARSKHGRVYAIAVLSSGARSATYPMVFEPARSYSPRLVKLDPPPAIPPIRTLGFSAQSLAPPPAAPPPTGPPPIVNNLTLPAPPQLPTFPSASAPTPAPPALPAPPAPPAGQQAQGLSLSVSAAGLTVPPTTGVTAQPTPPVQPSPPSGARREAKQRQAATAKSEEGTAADNPSSASGKIDLAGSPEAPHGAAFTRRERERAAPSFSVRPRAAQQSAWATGLVWGGGVGIMAFALAVGFTTLRPRRRPPVVPAPAWRRPS